MVGYRNVSGSNPSRTLRLFVSLLIFVIFLYWYYYLLFIVHEYWEFNPYALSCHPLINVLYIYRDSIYIQYTRSFYNVDYKLPINFTYCFEASMFTYTVAQYILAWLAYRLALDFFTSGPYLQRKIHPIKGHQFLLYMFILLY